LIRIVLGFNWEWTGWQRRVKNKHNLIIEQTSICKRQKPFWFPRICKRSYNIKIGQFGYFYRYA
jgi:hypothetical protein